MTRKEYVKAKVDFLKMMMGMMFGAMFAISLYNIQTSGANIIFVTISVVSISLVLILVYFLKYEKYLKELRGMHKDE